MLQGHFSFSGYEKGTSDGGTGWLKFIKQGFLYHSAMRFSTGEETLTPRTQRGKTKFREDSRAVSGLCSLNKYLTSYLKCNKTIVL